MYCNHCGSVINANDIYCTKCGCKTGVHEVVEKPIPRNIQVPVQQYASPYASGNYAGGGVSVPRTNCCPNCRSTNTTYSALVEKKKTTVGTYILYIVLIVSIIGWLVIIPLALSKRDEVHTYAICNNCGTRWRAG